MAWGKVDDGFYDHDKVLEMPSAIRNEACGLYWRAISFCNAKLTDGVISESIVEHLNGRQEVVAELLRVRLWNRRTTGKGFLVHDFADHNRTRAEVEADRDKKQAAGRLGGFRSGEARRKQGAQQSGSKREARAHKVVELPSESESLPITPPNPPRPRGGRKTTNGRSYDDLLKRDSDVDEPDADMSFEVPSP